MTNAVGECLRHINGVSNSNTVCNADGLLSRRKVDVPVDWVSEKGKRVVPEQFKVSY